MCEGAVKTEGKGVKGMEKTKNEKRTVLAERAGEAGAAAEREKAYLHWLYQAAGFGGRGFVRMLSSFGSAEEIYKLLCAGKLMERITPRYAKKVAQMAAFSEGYDVEAAYGRMWERGIRMVTETETDFPKRLRGIPDPPFALYYVGRLPTEGMRAVALIGARDCTEYGRYMAKQFGGALAGAGILVVSGMARGIDGIAQEAALRAHGYSLGVLGCGVDICYPRENRPLYEELLECGGVCSEYPPGIEPRAALFPPRNRIISGFCDAVLVVEAREKSGTLITVDMALEQGREVYALPGRATDPLSGGCNRLIRQGAGLVTTPEELLEELSGTAVGAFFGKSGGRMAVQGRLVFLEGLQGEIMETLDFSPLPAEELQRRYAKKQGKTIALPLLFQGLLELCAGGCAEQVGGSYFMRTLQ